MGAALYRIIAMVKHLISWWRSSWALPTIYVWEAKRDSNSAIMIYVQYLLIHHPINSISYHIYRWMGTLHRIQSNLAPSIYLFMEHACIQAAVVGPEDGTTVGPIDGAAVGPENRAYISSILRLYSCSIVRSDSCSIIQSYSSSSGPTAAPSSGPTVAPSSGSTTAPSSGPTAAPSSGPTAAPSGSNWLSRLTSPRLHSWLLIRVELPTLLAHMWWSVIYIYIYASLMLS